MKHFIKLVFALAAGLMGVHAFAQSPIITSGRIEYERTDNAHEQMGNSEWAERFKDRMAKYRKSSYNLYFNDSMSAFREIKKEQTLTNSEFGFFGRSSGLESIFITNSNTGETRYQKGVFERDYLIEDSLLQVEWRITDEFRTIAGFDCRKAVGRLYDSIYVVAFYSPQIVSPTGPFMFGGLPGTILGLAFPRYYVTIYATKLVLTDPVPADFEVKNNLRKINRREWFDLFREATSRWGSEKEKQQAFWMGVLL